MRNPSFKNVLIRLSSLLIFVAYMNGSINKSIQFQLPVRVLNNEKQIIRLNKNNVKLIINDEPRNITSLQYQQKSIQSIPDLGRYFILSFQISEFNKRIKTRISYLVTEILNLRDTLLIISPYKVYKIQASPNKDRMIRNIYSLIEQDYFKHQKNKVSFEKNLTNQIKQLGKQYSSTMQMPGPYVETVSFLNNFPSEFIKYYKYLLTSSIDKYQRIIDLLQSKEGERWLIHFFDFKIFDLWFKTIGITEKISEYINSRDWQHQEFALSLSNKLIKFKQQMAFTKLFPHDLLMKIIMRGNISYNVIFLGGTKEIDLETSNLFISELATIMKDISRKSGGIAVYAQNYLQELNLIKKHNDFYYTLGFDFNQKIEPKKIKILLNNQDTKNLIYRDLFEKEEIESLVHYIEEKKVKIIDLLIKARSIYFMVKSFGLHSIKDTSEIFGLLRITIQLKDQNRLIVFNSKKTLRAKKAEMFVSLSLPAQLKGTFSLSIAVIDLIANSKSSVDRKITLK